MTKWPAKARIAKAENYLIRKKAFGFMDGGCLIFAEAIKDIAIEARIVTILRGGKADHYGIVLGSGYWGDARGLHPDQYAWAQKYSLEERAFGRIEIVEDLVASREIPRSPEMSNQIAKILRL